MIYKFILLSYILNKGHFNNKINLTIIYARDKKFKKK